MKTIYKYEVPIEDEFSLNLPKGSTFLSLINQRGKPVLYFLVDPEEKTIEKIDFYLAGTGNPILENIDSYEFLGTFEVHPFVFHLFSRKVISIGVNSVIRSNQQK